MKEIENKIIDSVFGEFNKELIGDKVKLQNKVNKLQRMIDMINYLQPVEKEEFVLPEKWAIEDCKEVSKWSSKYFGCGKSPYHDRFLHVANLKSFGENYWFLTEIKEGYTEITFEQFKKYVLNK